MSYLDRNQLLARAQFVFEWFDQTMLRHGGQMTLETLVEEVALATNHTIRWGPTSDLEPTVAGQTTFYDGKYYLGYDANLSVFLMRQTVLHELVHILKGDAKRHTTMTLRRNNADLPTELLECETQDGQDQQENEQLVEFIAGCLAQKLTLKPPKMVNKTMQGWFKRTKTNKRGATGRTC